MVDFWGRVMSDYEEVASTQRECPPVPSLRANGFSQRANYPVRSRRASLLRFAG